MPTEAHGRVVNVGSESVTAPSLALRYETLVQVTQVIGAHGDPKELFGVLANELHRVVQFDFIGVSLRDRNSDTFGNYFIDMMSRSELRRRTVDEAHALFNRLGLTGD